MPEESYSLLEPQPGQGGWTDDSLEMVAGTGEGGHEDGLPRRVMVVYMGNPSKKVMSEPREV